MPCSLDQLVGDDDGFAVDDLGGADQRHGTPAERPNGDETPKHSVTVRCQTYQWRSIGASGANADQIEFAYTWRHPARRRST
jgi:hypothetical protein